MRKFGVAAYALAILLTLGLRYGIANASGNGYYSGVVREVHGDNLASKEVTGKHFILDSGKQIYNLTLPAGSSVKAGQKVSIQGHTKGNSLVAAQGGVTSAGTTTSTTAVSGNQTVAAVLFNFSNDSSQPYTTADAQAALFTNPNSANNFYQSSSNGQVSLTGNVYGYYTIPMDNTACDYTSWKTAADSAASAAGVNLSAYTYVIYEFPYTSSCNWGGLGYMPGNYSWINGGINNSIIAAHELGHNFGVNHANTYDCTDSTGNRVTFSTTCLSTEYGDPFSAMGSSGNLHTNWHRAQLGWLAPKAITASGQYLLPPMTRNLTGRLLSIPRSDGTFLQLEYRGGGDPYFDIFNYGDPVTTGVSIRLTPGLTTLSQSQLLDTTPATTTFDDAPLVAGQTFVDSVDNLTIRTVSVDSYNGATITVQLGSTVADTQPPTAPTNLSAKILNKKSVSLAWSASSDNFGVTGYKIFRNGTQIGTSTGTLFTDNPSRGTWTYTVAAYDATGNVSQLSNSATAKI